MLNKIIKIAPIIGALLVFCGVLKLIFFYSYFNIKIIDYLEFQEIITSFFEDMNIIIAFAAIMLVQAFAYLNILSRKSNLDIEDFSEKLLDFLFPYRFKIAAAFLVLLLIQIGLLYFQVINFTYLTIYLFIFCLIQLLTYILFTKDKDGQIDLPSHHNLFMLTSSLVVSVFLFAQKDIQDTLSNLSQTKIETLDGNIICNKRTGNIHIGKTNKYEFIKLKKSNSTIVIPENRILKYEFN